MEKDLKTPEELAEEYYKQVAHFFWAESGDRLKGVMASCARAYAQQQVVQERKAIMGKLCHGCRNGFPAKEIGGEGGSGGEGFTWVHSWPETGRLSVCKAAAIRARE